MPAGGSISRGIQAGSSAIGAGLSRNLQRQNLQANQEQLKRTNFLTQYKGNMDLAVKTLSTAKKQLDDQYTYQIQQIKNTVVPEKQNESIAAIEANYSKQLADLQKQSQDLFQTQFAPLIQAGSQVGYMQPAQLKVDQGTFETAVSGLRPDQQAIVNATTQGAQAAAKAAATNEAVIYQNKQGDTKTVPVTDTATIFDLQKQGYYPVNKVTVQGESLSSLTKPVRTKVQEKLIAVDDSLARLDAIERGFKPEFLQAWNRAGNEIMTAGEKWLGLDLNKQDKKALSEYKQFGQQSLSFLNEEIHRLTGAQLSVFEADRIRGSLPDFGEKWFKGNSPTEFLANLDSTRQALLASKARYEDLLTRGFIQEGEKFSETLSKEFPLENYMKRVNIISPQGVPGTIPIGQLEKAKAAGYKEAP